MIDLNRPPFRTDGLALFMDDADPHLWHYMPERPALSRMDSGTPGYLIIKYRLALSRSWPRGGGILHLEADLAASPMVLDRARAHITGLRGDSEARLIPVLPDRITCDLMLWTGESDGLSMVTAQPATAPPHHASFPVPLSIPAVTLLESALQPGGSAGGVVVYRLSVPARRRALPARATIDWRRILESFQVQFSGPEPVRYGRIASSVIQLVERAEIRIELSGSGDDVPAALGPTLEEVTRLVTMRLFHADRPAFDSLQPQPAMPPSIERAGLESQTYVLRHSSGERSTETVEFGQPREDQLMLASTATLDQMVESSGADIRAASLVALMEEIHNG